MFLSSSFKAKQRTIFKFISSNFKAKQWTNFKFISSIFMAPPWINYLFINSNFETQQRTYYLLIKQLGFSYYIFYNLFEDLLTHITEICVPTYRFYQRI